MSEKKASRLPENIIPVLAGATREELAVAVYLSVKDTYTPADGAKDLGITEEDFRAALSFWRGAGMRMEPQAEKTVSPESRDQRYDTKTVAESLETNGDFRAACESLQALYGKMFTQFDYDTLLYLYDHCGLTAAYMCTLASYCINRGKTTLKYFTKTAQNLVSDGVDTYEKLEQYFEKRNRAQDRVYKLRKLCGFGDRAFTSREEQYISEWFMEKDFSFELIKYAYELTVNAIGDVKLSYMNKILARWHKDGLLTVDSVKNSEQKTEEQTKNTGTSFNDDEFFAAAVARTKKKREERK